jgi:hypothetical protein
MAKHNCKREIQFKKLSCSRLDPGPIQRYRTTFRQEKSGCMVPLRGFISEPGTSTTLSRANGPRESILTSSEMIKKMAKNRLDSSAVRLTYIQGVPRSVAMGGPLRNGDAPL